MHNKVNGQKSQCSRLNPFYRELPNTHTKANGQNFSVMDLVHCTGILSDTTAMEQDIDTAALVRSIKHLSSQIFCLLPLRLTV